MISTTWTDAPAGFAGRGDVALPPYACPTVVGGTGVRRAPDAAPIRGTGLPVAIRLRTTDERGMAHQSSLRKAVAVVEAAVLNATSQNSATTENNGTTLGIHPPGRSQS